MTLMLRPTYDKGVGADLDVDVSIKISKQQQRGAGDSLEHSPFTAFASSILVENCKVCANTKRNVCEALWKHDRVP